mgnify:CR=1 FL=1
METFLGIMAAAFGSGWAIQIAFYQYERRKRIVDAKNAEIDLDTKQDQLHDKQLDNAFKQIVELQNIVDTERNKWIELAKKVVQLKTELLAENEARQLAEYDRCTVHYCENRIPPRGLNDVGKSS